MEPFTLPILLFVFISAAIACGMLLVPWLLAPRRQSSVKQMPYESGMDPIHDARRRFDVRFHLVAIVFLIFDVELLFLYPWAVSSQPAGPQGSSIGIEGAINAGMVDRWLVFGEVMVFVAMLAAGLAYAWRKGVFDWR